MAVTKNTSGLRLYALLKKEAYAANRGLPAPLSRDKVEKFIKTVLWPSWQGYSTRWAERHKTAVRADVAQSFKKFRTKKNKSLLLYNKLLHEASVLNQDIPEHQRLNIKELRKLISEKVFPKYKGRAISKIDSRELKRILGKELILLNRTVCDILAVPEYSYQDIPYYDIDTLCASTLPNCVYVEIVGGGFGRTDIFNTKDYNYYSSGLQSITNKINEVNPQRKSGEVPTYSGTIQVRPGKKNDGKPLSYYLEMILIFEGVPVDESEQVELPKHRINKKTKKQQRSDQAVRDLVKEGFKDVTFKKSAIKGFRKRLSKSMKDDKKQIDSLKSLMKSRILKDNQLLLDTYAHGFKKQKAKLDAFRKKHNMQPGAYAEILGNLTDFYHQKN